MKLKEIRELVKQYTATLSNEEKDEWWGTDRQIWDSMARRFLRWCEKNRKKVEDSKNFDTL